MGVVVRCFSIGLIIFSCCSTLNAQQVTPSVENNIDAQQLNCKHSQVTDQISISAPTTVVKHSREHVSAIFIITHRASKELKTDIEKSKLPALIQQLNSLQDKLDNLLKRNCCAEEVLALKIKISQLSNQK